MFQQLLKGAGISSEQVWIWNLVNCVPPAPSLNQFPSHPLAIAQCSSHLRSFIDQYKPRVILAMGENAIRVTTGLSGKKQTARELNGYILDSLMGPPVVATFSPTDLRIDLPSAFREAFIIALRQALALASGTSIVRPDLSESRIFCSPQDLREFMATLSPSDPIYYDIETPYSSTETEDDLRASSDAYEVDPLVNDLPAVAETPKETSTITQVQFAGPILNKAWVANWTPEIAAVCKEIFSLPNIFYGWNNRNFDNPILMAALKIPRPKYVDLMNCLHADTHVTIRNKGKIKIKDLTGLEVGAEVLAASAEGIEKWVKIKRIYAKRDPNVSWVQIKADNNRQITKATPDHLFWTKRGWVEAKDLTTKDYVITRVKGANDVIEGLLMGDGYHTGNYCLVYHGPRQAEYNKSLSQFFGTNIYPAQKGGTQISFNAPKYLKPRDSIFVPPSTDRALAVWYMDDGHLGKNRIVLSVNWAENPSELQSWFTENFGFQGGVAAYRSKSFGKQYSGLRIELTGQALKKFQSRIAAFILPCMDYKIQPSFRGRYNGWAEENSLQWAKVEFVKPLKSTQNKIRYCIDVEDDFHAFFADSILVHNCWHRFRPDLPMGLAFATPWFFSHVPAWKHLHMADPGLYGVLDVVALQHIHKGLVMHSPKVVHPDTKISLYTSFHTQDIPFTTALDHMQDRGYPLDKERLGVFDAKLADQIAELYQKMGPLFPEECLGTGKEFYRERPSKLRAGFTEEDLILETRQVPEQRTVAALRDTKALKGKAPSPEIEAVVGKDWDSIGEIPGRDKWLKAHTYLTGETVEEKVWVYRKQFNPGSRDQVLAYIRFKIEEEWKEFGARDKNWNGESDPRGYKTNHLWEIPKDPNDPSKDWVGAKGLLRLQAKLVAAGKPDPVLPLLIDYSKLSKMRSSFTKTWIPTERNLIHTTYKQNPATGQLAAVKPNLLQGPKHGTIAKQWKHVIRAHAGRRWINFDFSGFHALTTGFEANDPSYIRAARIDIHGILGYIKEQLPDYQRLIDGLRDPALMSDEEIAERVKKWARKEAPVVQGRTFKERRDKVYKATILGNQFGMRPRKMFNLNPDVFLSQVLAQEVWETERSIWPTIFEYQDIQRDKAARPPHWLVSRYGFVRYFFNVYDYTPDKVTKQMKKSPGKDSEAAVAFEPANDAFGHVRDTIIYLDRVVCPKTELTYAEKFGLVNNVHDSLEFHCPSIYTDECLDLVPRLMQRRNLILSGPAAPDGLWCGAEAEISAENEGMDTYEDVVIPSGPFDFDIRGVIGWPT